MEDGEQDMPYAITNTEPGAIKDDTPQLTQITRNDRK